MLFRPRPLTAARRAWNRLWRAVQHHPGPVAVNLAVPGFFFAVAWVAQQPDTPIYALMSTYVPIRAWGLLAFTATACVIVGIVGLWRWVVIAGACGIGLCSVSLTISASYAQLAPGIGLGELANNLSVASIGVTLHVVGSSIILAWSLSGEEATLWRRGTG